MDPITLLALALAQGLMQVGGRLVEKGLVEPALEPATELLQNWVKRGYLRAAEDQRLLRAVRESLRKAGVDADDPDEVSRWLKRVGLDRLAAEGNDALRRQVARGVLSFTDPKADPPNDLTEALGWPRNRRDELADLLTALRAQLASLDDWQAPIAYADQAAQRDLLRDILDRLSRLDRLIVHAPAGAALLVATTEAGLTQEEVAAIEARYRQDVVRELVWHDFRGIVQVRRAARLPLADIYLEPALLPQRDVDGRQRSHERGLSGRDQDGEGEGRRARERVTDALARAPRLVVLGGPGSGKTVSLRFIALMLAHGYGAARLGLEVPYIPLLVRLADYARALDLDPALSLCNYLLEYVEKAYGSDPRLSEFMRRALEEGTCAILLDGLDEVGGDPIRGRSRRTQVVKRVQRFADLWCGDEVEGDEAGNRLIVTSRLEGYWDEPLRGFTHRELSPLRVPDEVEAFLLRWYTAHELTYGPDADLAEDRAQERVDHLLPQVLEWPSLRRLATNPLLLTILALVHENVGWLPSRRIKLYEVCAQTLIESWRQAQTERPSRLLTELGEGTVIRLMAPLAYWLHEEHPGGTASYQVWRDRLIDILKKEGFEEDAVEIADRFLHHARYQTGLLAERGVDQVGFFHVTFEEYLAAREMARQRTEERRELLRAHWEDPRWHGVILLAAGQLAIVEARRDDVSDFLENLLKMEPQDAGNEGRQAVLAGRALVDIGSRSVTNTTRRWVLQALEETMQDRDPETGRLRVPAQLPVRTRFDSGKALDELGWLAEDLDSWIRCPGTGEDGVDLMAMKYPVTNAQYEYFVAAGGYENVDWWSAGGWQWRLTDHTGSRGEGPVCEPQYWRDPRLGKDRRGYPVVGLSWYEASAFCRWVTDVLMRVRMDDPELSEEERSLVADLAAVDAVEVRLPTEAEWVALAGGTRADRYPWDPPAGPPTEDEAAILARANTREAALEGTTPVGMYPLGASVPYGLMDLAGNVWEWTGSPWERGTDLRALRGGSWSNSKYGARCGARGGHDTHLSLSSLGLRCVAPVPRP